MRRNSSNSLTRMGSRTGLTATPSKLLSISIVFITLFQRIISIERPHYKTAYACEGNILHISCDNGQLIHLIRANYGRFSITICNEHGNTDWSVNCIAPRSFRVLQERCSQQTSCTIQASTSVFGDPCAGTLKYLEAHYQCLPASTTTVTTPVRFPPPWLAPTTQPAWVTLVTRPNIPVGSEEGTPPVTTTTSTPNPQVSSSSSTGPPPTSAITVLVPVNVTQIPPTPVPSPAPKVPQNESKSLPPKPTKPALNSTTAPTTSTTSIWWDFRADYCPPVRVRNLNWNWTKQGDVAAIHCPIGTTGTARWSCGSNPARWMPENPDLSDCKSAWLTDLANRIDDGDNLVKVATELVQVTSSNQLYGGDMVETAAMLKKMAHKMSERIKILPRPQKQDVVKELMKAVVETGSNLLAGEQRHSWNDLSRQTQMKTATALLLGLEENAYLLADHVNYEKVTVQADKNILMSVKVLKTENVRELNFPEPEDLSNSVWDQTTRVITLPSEALMDRASSGLVKVVFFTYNNIEELLQPFSSKEAFSQIGNSSRTIQVLNSKVISASFGRKHHMPLQQQSVFITLKHIQEDNVTNPTCVYWDYSRSTWSPSGCEVVTTNHSHTVCACNHLTNFAILMDVQGLQMDVGHEKALQLITYIGCVISIVCLTLSFLTFTCFRSLKSDRNTIHKNLSVCLLIAEILFVSGISQTDKPILCGFIAGFLHFFFLCSFAWMFFEGFQLYVMLIEVFESEKSRVRWYYALAYGLSIIVVAVSCVIDPFSYGTEKYCWLRTDNYFIFSFVGPVIAVIVANIVFLSIALFMMCRHANVSAMKKKEQSRLTNIRREEVEVLLHERTRRQLAWIRGALALVFLLGLTWTFGLLYLNEESIVMAYVFTILNSLQGLFIFVFHCIQNEKVRKEYRKLFRHSPCLPSCMREGAKERRSSFYANSNGTASMPNSSSTPVNSQQQQQSYLKRLWGSGKSKSPQTSSTNGDLSRGTPVPLSGVHPTAPDLEVEKFSYNSSNRDSGHGGSEPEESLGAAGSLRYKRNNIDYGGITNDLSVMDCSVVDSDCSSEYFREKMSVNNDLQRSARSLRPPPNHHHSHHNQRSNNNNNNNTNAHHHHPNQHAPRLSPLNHIYMDIESRDNEPVYEEIDRSEVQVSDYSDEDGRRRSDISRQSSGSYGDNRPLIAHLIAERNQLQTGNSVNSHHGSTANRGGRQRPSLQDATAIVPEGPPYHVGQMPPHPQPIVPQQKEHRREPSFHGPVPNNLQRQHQPPPKCDIIPPSDSAMFVAMLDGPKVVCKLQPHQIMEQPQPQQQQQPHLNHPHQQQHHHHFPMHHHRLSHSEC